MSGGEIPSEPIGRIKEIFEQISLLGWVSFNN